MRASYLCIYAHMDTVTSYLSAILSSDLIIVLIFVYKNFVDQNIPFFCKIFAFNF